MRTKLLYVILFLICSVSLLKAQDRTDYSTKFIDGPGWNNICPSSTYWMGDTYIFSAYTGMSSYSYRVSNFSINDNGDLDFDYTSTLYNGSSPINMASCVFKKNLYGFYWVKFGYQLLRYTYRTPGSGWSYTEIILPAKATTVQNMSAVAYQDAIYLFFIDEYDNKVKYFKILLDGDGPGLALESQDPTVFNDEASIGNVAAIKYIDSNMDEKIMIAYPGEYKSRDNNEIHIYTGTPGNFSHYADLPCKQDYSCWNIAMAQGSVKGGSEGSYNIQFGYTHYNNDSGLERCELNVDNNAFSNWEELSYDGYIMGRSTWFSVFYSKSSQTRKKFLLQGYNCGDGARGALWESDKLQYKDQVSEIPPFDRRTDFFDVILVAEGAPPYALNGYKLGDDIFNGNPLSEFAFTNETENSLSTSTTYSQSVEANMGVGPVSAGFKASFQESSGTSTTQTLAVTQTILPPTSQQDSAGVMWYYYIAPTVTRSRWSMQDYNGNDISPTRELFFFNFDSPQLKTMAYPLTNYGDNSPRAYDLHTYEARGVENMSGMEKILRNETDINIKQGGTGHLELTFSQTNTNSLSRSFDVSLGIDATVGIFSASASASAGFEYSRERTTTCSKSFYLNWNLFAPTVPDDTANIRKYTAVSFLMKTTDSTAYYLLDGMEDYKPYFLTFEVKDIEHGDFLHSINEINSNITKYQFRNFPNPCINATEFNYKLIDKALVRLEVFDVLGQNTGIHINTTQNPGQQKIEVSTSELPSGIYYYNLSIGSDLISGKFIKH